jgi:hypothetical protein
MAATTTARAQRDELIETKREAAEMENMTHRQKYIYESQGQPKARTGLTPRRNNPRLRCFKGWGL